MDRAATQVRDGEPCVYEVVSEYADEDLGYTLEIERTRARLGSANAVAEISLRVTTIFRREDGVWKIVHRHADPITEQRPAESLLNE